MNKQGEDKARELADKYCTWTTCFNEYENACLEMANWKEQQLIEKAVEYLEPVFKNLAGYNCGGDLIEDFKKYMEEN